MNRTGKQKNANEQVKPDLAEQDLEDGVAAGRALLVGVDLLVARRAHDDVVEGLYNVKGHSHHPCRS